MAFYDACRFFIVRIFLKLLAVFVGRHRSFSLFFLVVFSLFLSAVSEASRYFVGCLFAVVIGCLGSFSSAVLEASFCRSCCFIVGRFLAALASCSCCFLAFFGRSSRGFSSLFFSFLFSKKNFWLSVSNWSTI